MKAMKKPITVRVFQMTKAARMDNSDWPEWLHKAWNFNKDEEGALYPSKFPHSDGTDTLRINTLEGVHEVSFNDWVIQGVKGEIYPCKPDIFAATYDIIPEWMATD